MRACPINCESDPDCRQEQRQQHRERLQEQATDRRVEMARDQSNTADLGYLERSAEKNHAQQIYVEQQHIRQFTQGLSNHVPGKATYRSERQLSSSGIAQMKRGFWPDLRRPRVR